MSRSYINTPISGITKAQSEKKDKRLANRRFRRVIRQILRTNANVDTFPDIREISNVWSMDKDGKRWIRNSPRYSDSWLRK